jgi:MFS family permease
MHGRGGVNMAMQPGTLGELEGRIYRSTWSDGVADLLGGIGVLTVGATWSMEIFWAVGFVVPVLLVAWTLLRKRVVEPRAGRVRFSQERRGKEKRGTQGAALIGVGVLLFFVALSVVQMRRGAGFLAPAQEWIAGLPAALLALMALMAAAMTGVTRFIGFAALLVAAGTLGTLLGLEPGPQILIGGGVITLIGLIIFLRFLSSHPKPAEVEEVL